MLPWLVLSLPGLALSLEHVGCQEAESAYVYPAHAVSKACRTSDYRSGLCEECNCCPRCYSCVELAAPEYNCAVRNNITVKVTEKSIDVSVGDPLSLHVSNEVHDGWLQCAALPSLPRGLNFTDDGDRILSSLGRIIGIVARNFDQHAQFNTSFFAFSTARWQEGIVKAVFHFSVHNNTDGEEDSKRRPPGAAAFQLKQREEAERTAHAALSNAFASYTAWEQQRLSHVDTVSHMLIHLGELKEVLDKWPHLNKGMSWAYLGGLHMNVHKLMENVLLDCEFYLGQALLFPSAEVRSMARENLAGCYAKRQLEAAKFMWLEGMGAAVDGRWAVAEAVLSAAAGKKDGWGWGVNNGDIWITLGAVQLVQGLEKEIRELEHEQGQGQGQGQEREHEHEHEQERWPWLKQARTLLERARERNAEHPWMRYTLHTAGKIHNVTIASSSNSANTGSSSGSSGSSGSSSSRTERLAVLRTLLVDLTHETKAWSEQVRRHVQAKPRPEYKPFPPPMPWDGQLEWGYKHGHGAHTAGAAGADEEGALAAENEGDGTCHYDVEAEGESESESEAGAV